MFGKIIYYDKTAINDYKSIINGKPSLEISEYSVSNEKGINTDLKVFGADANSTKTYTAKVQESNMLDCAEFEKMLSGRDDFRDFTLSANYDISTVFNRRVITILLIIAIMYMNMIRNCPSLSRSHQFGGSISFLPFLWTKNLTLGDILCLDLN